MGISSSSSPSTAGTVHKSGVSLGTALFSSASTTFVDITNPASFNLVTTKTCTIAVSFTAGHYNSTANTDFTIQVLVGANVVALTQDRMITLDQTQTGCYSGIVKGVAAGTITIKAQMKVSAGTGGIPYTAGYNVANLSAIAYEE